MYSVYMRYTISLVLSDIGYIYIYGIVHRKSILFTLHTYCVHRINVMHGSFPRNRAATKTKTTTPLPPPPTPPLPPLPPLLNEPY